MVNASHPKRVAIIGYLKNLAIKQAELGFINTLTRGSVFGVSDTKL